jgi:hypothetical protein
MGMLAMLDDKSKGREISDRLSASAEKLAMGTERAQFRKESRMDDRRTD